QFLGVVGPALDERAGVQGPPDRRGRVPQRPAVREVPGRDLVHGDPGQRRLAEDLQPVLLLLPRPGRGGRGDVVPGGALRAARGGRGPSGPPPTAVISVPARPGTRRRGRGRGRVPW